MMNGDLPMDWGFAETMAYASVLDEGYQIRIDGQDSQRGTFFHRHAVIHNVDMNENYTPLSQLETDKNKIDIINSVLSEEAVLGFEYGYATTEPRSLVIWEAQFGDFANNAQVVIDQFLTSSEAKWQRYCGLVMFLPHGYDGQGPEHSSARLERYLQLCAEDNIQVCMPSTPAQIFHMLRRQMLRPYRKPLIVMTPKSLLRHKLAVSPFEDFTDRGFQTVIDETAEIEPKKVERLLLCSGKVYFDLLEARAKQGIDNIAIVRIEQLYPFPEETLAEVQARYPHVKQRVWVQEEPRNQGAWWFLRTQLNVGFSDSEMSQLEYAGRPPSASPAVGYSQLHREQREQLIADALQLNQ